MMITKNKLRVMRPTGNQAKLNRVGSNFSGRSKSVKASEAKRNGSSKMPSNNEKISFTPNQNVGVSLARVASGG